MSNLVGYSSSEDSDTDLAQATVGQQKSIPATNARLQDINPPKIRVNLGPLPSDEEAQKEPEGPPAKRQRTSAGSRFSGLNSFLPAPKRSAGQTVSAAVGGGESVDTIKSRRAPFKLKTSSEAAFERGEGTSESAAAAEAALANVLGKKKNNASPQETAAADTINKDTPVKKPKLRPLSVQISKKKAKKKVAGGAANAENANNSKMEVDPPSKSAAEAALPPPPSKPKVSLFSNAPANNARTIQPRQPGEYKPMLLDDNDDEDEDIEDNDEMHLTANNDSLHATANPLATTEPSASTSSNPAISAIYNQLSESERRRLFGRKGATDPSVLAGINIKDFNADAEYTANEELRARGDQQEVNTVRPIKPGKHSLRQLVNVAVSQKDALEESYARGAANKREGGSKYGW